MKYLLDTNILIYLKDPYSEHYDTVGRNFLKKLANDIDLILAGTAIIKDAVFVSNDCVFNKLQDLNPDLKYENWTLEVK